MLVFNLFLWIFNFPFIYSMSLIEYPLRLEKTNRIIHASLTDKESGQIWTIEERIAADERIEGRIDVSSPKLQEFVNVFYSFKQGSSDNQRLVIQGQDCDHYLYRTSWDKQFPGVTKPLTNMVLLMGPSFFFRLIDSRWTEGKAEVIRGALMNSATLILEQKLKVTTYYKGDFPLTIGVSQPNRIVLTGYDPKTGLVDQDIGETLVLDIFLQSDTYKNLSGSVQPTPGIGCPTYLQKNIKLPTITANRIHFIAKDTSNKQSDSLKEIHADTYQNVMRMAEIRLGMTTTSIFDYNLGVQYVLSKSGSCSTYGADLKSPGIDATSQKFSLPSLLWLDGAFKYLGQVVFEHRAGIIAQVWESIQTDRTLPNGKYDKVVTTAYFTPSLKETIFGGYIFVATTRNAYKKDNSGKFKLVESIHRDYYDFEVDEPEAEYESAFKLSDCYTDSTDRLTLTMHITCDLNKMSNCIKMGEDSTNVLRESLIEKIDRTYSLSILRIIDIEFVFRKERIEADITFSEAPDLTGVFAFNYQDIDLKSIKQLHQVTSTKSEQECLKFQSSFYDSGRAVIYCKDGNKCISVADRDSIKNKASSHGGTTCIVYDTPLENLYRLGQEKKLQEIHDHILKTLVRQEFTLSDRYSGNLFTYEISDVVANNKREEGKERELFSFMNAGTQLVPNGFDIIEVPNIKRFSDCYRACSKSEEIFCETFSFCEEKDTTKCIVSTLNRDQVNKNLTITTGCMTYEKNHVTDYIMHPNKAYKVPSSVSQKLWIDDCARECATSPDCSSFEFCNGRCTFGGYYSESSTKFKLGCEIYSPKLSHRYELTGSNIVTEVLHTELDLDLDQCAVFCFDYNRGDGETCESFNYCPKGGKPASCQLTKHSISNSETVTTQSPECHNFELIHKNGHKRFEQEDTPIAEKQTVRTSGSGAFGIITLFLFIGLFVGFVGPYTMMKIKSSSVFKHQSNDFNWSRQVDAAEEEQSEVQI